MVGLKHNSFGVAMKSWSNVEHVGWHRDELNFVLGVCDATGRGIPKRWSLCKGGLVSEPHPNVGHSMSIDKDIVGSEVFWVYN